MGGSKGGGSSSNPKPSPYETALSNIAQGTYDQTTGLRNQNIGMLEKFGSSGYNPTELPGFAPLFGLGKQGLESQYSQAKSNIIGSTPAGGALTKALANLEMGRAQQVGSMPAQISGPIIQDLLNKSYGAAWNAPGQAMQGLGAAANSWTSRANAGMAADAQSQAGMMAGLGGLGQGIGTLLTTPLKGTAMGAACCFVFAAGNALDPVVRRYRDEHLTTELRRGYCRMADHMVPWMKRSRMVLNAVQVCMIHPLTAYGKWHYGENRWGWIAAPVKWLWFGIWDSLGRRGPYRRRNTGEVV